MYDTAEEFAYDKYADIVKRTINDTFRKWPELKAGIDTDEILDRAIDWEKVASQLNLDYELIPRVFCG